MFNPYFMTASATTNPAIGSTKPHPNGPQSEALRVPPEAEARGQTSNAETTSQDLSAIRHIARGASDRHMQYPRGREAPLIYFFG
jgi:hypothetical protein